MTEASDNTEIKVGDVVVLKSGSPEMTVSSIGETKNADCVWFDKESSSVKSQFIPLIALCKKTAKPATVTRTRNEDNFVIRR